MQKIKTKKLLTYIVIPLVVLLILGISMKLITKSSTKKNNETSSVYKENTNQVIKNPIATSKNGNIYYEENEYFKKYTIKCDSEVNELKPTEDDKFLFLSVNTKGDLAVNTSTINKNYKNLIFYKDKKKSNSIYIEKSFAKNNFIYVDNEDKKNIIIILAKSENPYKYKVLLDAGHGGEDKGASNGNLYEKDITLKVVKDMEKNLIYNGCEVKLSRDKDVLNALTDIANMSNAMKADAMVSIHVNKFQEEKYNGIGTYYVDNGTFSQERTKLAQIIQKQVIKSDNWGDRGIFKLKPTDLKLLRLSERPCVLVECGFLSNDGDVKRLSDDKVLANLAQNVDNGILEFLKSK